MKKKLSVVLAVKNEEAVLADCLRSVRQLADEIVIVDDQSTDRTVEIAKSFGAKVTVRKHIKNFHENKQLAIKKATSDWALQLDADERVTPSLAKEIIQVLEGKYKEDISSKKRRLFQRHQKAVEKLWGKTWKESGEVVAYFIPRLNMFLGKPLRYAGVYPDAVIRLVKKGKGNYEARSVHEMMRVDGQVGWLTQDLEHYESPTLARYIARANRYTTLTAQEFKVTKMPKNLLVLFFYSLVKPGLVFLKLFFRHKGFLDGLYGFLWSAFSALHFPIAYWKYWVGKYNRKR
jgi:glycosyltransferase involved in cell wall biosynthesis